MISDLALSLVADYGVGVVFVVTFLSCLALPVPSSLLMLAAGGFTATGDLSLMTVLAAAFCGAILGDNTGYWLARGLGLRFQDWLNRSARRRTLRERTEKFMTRWGGSSIFFSCWLVAPLGPYVNYVSGFSNYQWLRFALWGVAGETVWVGLYVGSGYVFADSIATVADVLGNASGLISATVASIALGWWLWRLSDHKTKQSTKTAL